jgi:hypothetical protein
MTDLLKKILYSFVGSFSRGSRSYAGIYHSGGEIFATDGHTLFILKTPYEESLEGKFINREGLPVETSVPQYRSAIPPQKAEFIVPPSRVQSLKKSLAGLTPGTEVILYSRGGALKEKLYAATVKQLRVCFKVFDALKEYPLMEMRLSSAPQLNIVMESPNGLALFIPQTSLTETPDKIHDFDLLW